MAKPHQKTSPAAIEKRQRMAEALKHRSEGLLYREIAEKMGVGLSTAYQYVRDAVDELPRENAELVYSIELDRLDMAQKALRPAVEQGDPKSIEAWLKIHDKRVRLFHLDKLHGKGDDTGDNVIATLAKAVLAAHEQQKDHDDDD